MAGRVPTCPVCNLKVDKTDISTAIKRKNRYYHVTCVDNENKNKTDERTKFIKTIDYLMEKSETELPRSVIEKQVKQMIEEGKKINGIAFTSKYFFEVLHKKISKKQGIKNIAFYYKEAEEFYKIKQINKTKEVDLKPEERFIQVSKPRTKLIDPKELGGV